MLAAGDSAKAKHLILATVGDESCHRSWLEPAAFRSFDLCLIYTGSLPGLFADDADYYFESNEDRWNSVGEALLNLGTCLNSYQAVWISDGTIVSDAFTINQMFHIFTDQKLWLAQPAFQEGSKVSRPDYIRHPEYILRFAGLDECPAPILSPGALKACLNKQAAVKDNKGFPFSKAGSLRPDRRKTAIIDAVQVRYFNPSSDAAKPYQAVVAPTAARRGSTAARRGSTAASGMGQKRNAASPPTAARPNRRRSRPTVKLKRKFIKKLAVHTKGQRKPVRAKLLKGKRKTGFPPKFAYRRKQKMAALMKRKRKAA